MQCSYKSLLPIALRTHRLSIGTRSRLRRRRTLSIRTWRPLCVWRWVAAVTGTRWVARRWSAGSQWWRTWHKGMGWWAAMEWRWWAGLVRMMVRGRSVRMVVVVHGAVGRMVLELRRWRRPGVRLAVRPGGRRRRCVRPVVRLAGDGSLGHVLVTAVVGLVELRLARVLVVLVTPRLLALLQVVITCSNQSASVTAA